MNFFVRRTVAELRGVKVAQFSDFGLFSSYKTPKKYLPVTSLQPRGYIAEWLRFFRVVVEVLPSADLSCDGRGAGEHKLAQNFAYGKCSYPYRMLLHGATDRDQRCLKKRNSKEGCTFLSHSSPFSPISPKTPFCGSFNAKPVFIDNLGDRYEPWLNSHSVP